MRPVDPPQLHQGPGPLHEGGAQDPEGGAPAAAATALKKLEKKSVSSDDDSLKRLIMPARNTQNWVSRNCHFLGRQILVALMN